MAESATERAFDHLVLCVDNLDAARITYEALGFTTTPNAVHPFGTGNFLIQLQGCFLELLTVADPRRITAPAPEQFSFGDYTRRYLGRREGFSMLALRSGDAAADRAAFTAAGLDTYPLFEVENLAHTRDLLETRNIAFRERRTDEQPSALRIGSGTAFGAAIEFVSPSC